MKKEALNAIEGIEIYPVISIIILGTFFIGVLAYAFTMKKGKVEDMSDLPFSDKTDKDF